MKKCIALLLAVFLVCGALPITAAAQTAPDLVVDSLIWEGGDGQVTPGTRLSFSAVLRNQGEATVNTPFSVTLTANTASLLTVICDHVVAAGATVTVSLGEWEAVAGDYMMAVSADADNAVAESNEKNNTYQRNLRVADTRLTSACDSTAAILEAAGMTDLVFSDDFDSLATIDTEAGGQAGYKWYVTRPYNAVTLTTADYSIHDGVLTVKNIAPTYNYGLSTVDMNTQAGFAFNTGYLEVRLRIPRPRKNTEGEEGIPAIWTLPTQKLFDDSNDTQWIEVDWLEYWGDSYATVTLHESIIRENGSNSDVLQRHNNSNSTVNGLDDGEWHIMGWLWQEGLFIAYLDGEEVIRVAWKEGEYATPFQSTAVGLPMEGAFVHLDTQTLPIVLGGSVDNPMELDWVRVWDGTADTTYVPPKKDDTPSTAVTLTAEEFCYNYATDAYGELITTVNTDNSQNILDGEAIWNAMTDTQKAAVDALLAAKGQSPFSTLLAAAKRLHTTATTPSSTTSSTAATTAVTTTATTAATEATVPATGQTLPLVPILCFLGAAAGLLILLRARRHFSAHSE